MHSDSARLDLSQELYVMASKGGKGISSCFEGHRLLSLLDYHDLTVQRADLPLV